MKHNQSITLQWTDLPLETLAKKAQSWGYDGLEFACDVDHFEIDKAISEKSYIQDKHQLLKEYNLDCYVINVSLVGQYVVDRLIDKRHHRMISARAWGDGDPEGVRHLDGRNSILGSHQNFGDPHRGWEFVSDGHGGLNWSENFRALNRIGYNGPLSVEWEDKGMDCEYGVTEALDLVRRFNFPHSSQAFDAVFKR